MKLIKLNTDHYIIVDDSGIKEGDWMYNPDREPSLLQCIGKGSIRGWNKITHSTQPIEEGTTIHGIEHKRWNHVKFIDLSEVKELIGEVDVENKAEEKYPKSEFWVGSSPSRLYDENAKERRCFIEGYNQALEDNKNKKYTEEDLKCMFECGRNYQNNAEITFKVSMEYLQSKTEWEVEFVDGKLKLK